MKNGIWKSARKLPVLLMAFAVAPAVKADNWTSAPASSEGYSAIPTPMIAAAPVAKPSSLIAPEAPVAEQSVNPLTACAPSACTCGPEGGCTFNWGPDKWCNVGAGIRTSFNSVDNGWVKDRNFFAVDEARLFFTGKVHQYIGFELNTDISGAGGRGFTDSSGDLVNLPDTIHLLDAVVKFEFNDCANFWVGRFLPPSDRANLDGPFFINGWDYPFVSNYPGIFEGRDDGAVYWGQTGGGMLHWSFGLFNGQGRFSGGNDWPLGGANSPNQRGNMEFAMRVQVDLLDPEPGYYTQSTYYGQKDILAIGFAMQDQTDAVADNSGHVGTFVGWNFDFLYENKMTAWGSGTLEGAYYNYNVGGGVVNGVAGRSGFVFAGWLLPQQIGCGYFCGRVRPYVRYQNYDRSDDGFAASNHLAHDEWDFGAQYVIAGHNARFDTFYGTRNDDGGEHESIFRTGFQLIF